MTLRLDREQERRLERLAKLLHVSKAAVLKQALDEKYDRERHRMRVRKAVSLVKDRDRAILERLADA